MAKRVTVSKSNRKLMILILLFLVFSAGLLLARTRYKPQIRASYNMVMERENQIKELKAKIYQLENPVIKRR